MLENLRAQGIELPEVGEKRPRPGTRIRPKKKDQATTNQTEESSNGVETKNDASPNQEETKAEEVAAPPVEVIKEAWDASSSEDESKDESAPAKAAGKTAAAPPKPTASTQVSVEKSDSQDESESGEDEDESSDEDDSEESDEEDNKKTDAEIKREKAWERILVSQKTRHPTGLN